MAGKASKFAELQKRAAARRAERVHEYELFGVDDGFDPPVVVKRMTPDEMDRAATLGQSNPLSSIKITLGEDNYRRIIDALGEDADVEVLAEIANDVNSFFYGEGSTDVPGGSAAS